MWLWLCAVVRVHSMRVWVRMVAVLLLMMRVRVMVVAALLLLPLLAMGARSVPTVVRVTGSSRVTMSS